MATIKDVARAAGVSISTASVALSGKGSVSEKTRARVIEVAHKLKYRPNAVARSLVTRRTRSVGLILSDITDPYFHEIAKGVQRTLSTAGYTVVLADTDRSSANESRSIQTLLDHQVDGLILAGSGRRKDEDHLRRLKEEKMAVVTVGRYTTDFPHVCVDNAAAAYVIADHLCCRGYRRIAFIGGPDGLLVTEDRFAGFCRALSDYGLEFDPMLVRSADFTPAGGYKAAMALLKTGRSNTSPVEAVIAANDQMAIGVMKAAKDFGILIPRQMAVAGIGDIPTALYLDPSLSTVTLPLQEMGRAAAGRLMKAIDREDGDHEILLDIHLRIRNSTPRLRWRKGD